MRTWPIRGWRDPPPSLTLIYAREPEDFREVGASEPSSKHALLRQLRRGGGESPPLKRWARPSLPAQERPEGISSRGPAGCRLPRGFPEQDGGEKKTQAAREKTEEVGENAGRKSAPVGI